MRLALLFALFSSFAVASPINGAIDGVTYTLQSSEVGNGYVDYLYNFSVPVSSYSIDVVWYGAPDDYDVVATYGGITQQSTSNGILTATLSGTVASSPAAVQYNTDAMTWLALDFESRSKTSLDFPSLTFTSLVDPPLSGGPQGLDASIAAVPEPATPMLIFGGLALTMLTYKSGHKARFPHLRRM